MLKLAGRIALIVLVLLAGAIAALAFLAEPALRLALRLTGVETVRFEGLRLDLGTVELAGVELGVAGAAQGQRVERVRIAYRAADLLRGELGPVELEGLELRGRLSEDGFSLAGLDAGENGGRVALPLEPERLFLRDAEIAIATPFGELIGMLDDDLHLTGPLSLDPSLLLKRAQGEGRFTVAAEDLEVGGLGRKIELSGSAALDLGRGRLRVVTADLTLTVTALGPELEPVGTALPAPWRISTGEAAPLAIEIEPLDQGWALRLAGPVRVAASAGQVTAELATELELGPHGGLRELSPSRAVVTASDLRAYGLAMENAWVELTGQGDPGDLQGTLQLEVTGAGALGGGLTVEGVDLRHDLAATYREGRLELRARDAGNLALRGLD